MTTVMIFGTFDHLHDGHRFLVRQAMKRGRVTAIVATDPNVKKIKGRSALQSAEKRVEALVSEFPEVKVLPGSSEDFLAPVRAEKPDLILLGYDQKLPPGVSLSDLKCPWERVEALKPHLYKSSLLSREKKGVIEGKGGK